MISVTPDWTPAKSRDGSIRRRIQTRGALPTDTSSALGPASQSQTRFRNAHQALQGCPIAKLTTLSIVCHFIPLTIDSMASDLLNGRNVLKILPSQI